MPIEETQSISPRYLDDVSVVYTLEFNFYHRVDDSTCMGHFAIQDNCFRTNYLPSIFKLIKRELVQSITIDRRVQNCKLIAFTNVSKSWLQLST